MPVGLSAPVTQADVPTENDVFERGTRFRGHRPVGEAGTVERQMRRLDADEPDDESRVEQQRVAINDRRDGAARAVAQRQCANRARRRIRCRRNRQLACAQILPPEKHAVSMQQNTAKIPGAPRSGPETGRPRTWFVRRLRLGSAPPTP